MNKLYSIMNSGSTFGLLLQVVPITVLVGAIYAVYRYIRTKKQDDGIRWKSEAMRLLFVCYLTGLINLILVPANFWMHFWETVYVGYSHSEIALFSGEFNLVPTIVKLIMGELTLGRWVLKMLIYNFLMFIPFGFFMPFISEKINTHNVWKFAVIIPVAVELIQPIIGRSFDTDDLILNFAGIIVGYFIAATIKSIIGKNNK